MAPLIAHRFGILNVCKWIPSITHSFHVLTMSYRPPLSHTGMERVCDGTPNHQPNASTWFGKPHAIEGPNRVHSVLVRVDRAGIAEQTSYNTEQPDSVEQSGRHNEGRVGDAREVSSDSHLHPHKQAHETVHDEWTQKTSNKGAWDYRIEWRGRCRACRGTWRMRIRWCGRRRRAQMPKEAGNRTCFKAVIMTIQINPLMSSADFGNLCLDALD